MELWHYLTKKKRTDKSMTNKKFAGRLGVTSVTLSRIVNYKQMPSVELAKKIEKETEGHVSWYDLLDMCDKSLKGKEWE